MSVVVIPTNDENGNGEWKDGYHHGQGKFVFDGTKKEGIFEKGGLIQGTIKNDDGTLEEGKFDENAKLIQGTKTAPDGTITLVGDLIQPHD